MALALGVAACSSSDGEPVAAQSQDGAAESDGGTQGDDSAASTSLLDVSAPAADGSTIDLSVYAGQDLLLWFWAPW